ncbi:MAG: glutamine synthetase [Clostridiales bacterium]|nr:glutamine synthetase [Clostridiales bacterium]
MNFDLKKMLFTVPKENHGVEDLTQILRQHPEVKFVSVVGTDLGGHNTDAKIPMEIFLEDVEGFLSTGVQTDGSSVVLPKIAAMNNAKIDLIPDRTVNWYVDYDLASCDRETGLPNGTLRIPAYLFHNDTVEVGSRYLLRRAGETFRAEVLKALKEHPYVFDYLPIDSFDEIDTITMTGATELEFWVQTPEDKANREQLSISQELKEQYWQRTRGPVRTALEECLVFLDQYGIGVEMGHKEVGGIKAKLGASGRYDHIMEQLEIDWKFSESLMQASDVEILVRNTVKDIFRSHGLDVTFMAKPIIGVAGNGEHTHLGAVLRLKNGKKVNLFAAKEPDKHFLNPVGMGALMGLLKNYEVVNAFVACTNDALNRLKPGFEAPVCIVTSLGQDVLTPSRNRTVLAGLIRDLKNPRSTRFELRSPNPKNNTYLVFAVSYMAMLDGVLAALEAEKTPEELEASISKAPEDKDFYLEEGRAYRTEEDVFEDFTQEERDAVFGKAPATVWESVTAFQKYPEKTAVLKRGDVFSDLVLDSYQTAYLNKWSMELHERLIPDTMALLRRFQKVHTAETGTDYDDAAWAEVNALRQDLGQTTLTRKSLLFRIKEALDNKDYALASELQKEAQEKKEALIQAYVEYEKNLL